MRYVFPLEGRTGCQLANSLPNGNATFGSSIGERDEYVGGRNAPGCVCFIGLRRMGWQILPDAPVPAIYAGAPFDECSEDAQ